MKFQPINHLTLVSLIILFLLGGCLPAQRTPPPTFARPTATPIPATPIPVPTLPPLEEDLPEVALRLMVTYLSDPTYVTAAGDGSGRLFILERRGKMLVVENGVLQAEPFLDLTDIVESHGQEQGLLGLAFHPNFPQDHRFFLNYTIKETDETKDNVPTTIVASYEVTPDLQAVDLASRKILLTFPQPHMNHNGGHLAFRPSDGYLYIASGEGGIDRGSGPDSYLGKLLRIDVDQGDPYAIPPDNPFVDQEGYLPEIWALGMRNPWRFSFDRQTDDLYIADVGHSYYEELDFEPAGSPGGLDYGWSRMEAGHCFESNTCDREGLTLPIMEYGRDMGCSITGGYVYRGEQFPALEGLYIFSDFCTGPIWGLKAGFAPVEMLETILNPSSFGEDAAGELYVVDFTGSIYQIIVPSETAQTNWPGAWPLADTPSVVLEAAFEDGVQLLGYHANRAFTSGSIIWLTLFWQGQSIPDTSTVFVQVRNEANETVSQTDHPLYVHQTMLTEDGLTLRDGATLALPPTLPPGDYRILVGFYDPVSNSRLSVIDDQTGEEAVILTEFTVD